MLVGELCLFDGAARSSSASAIHESKLSFVSRAAFDAIASARPEIYRYITAVLTRRLRDIDEALKATSFLPLKGRAATALLSLSDAFGKDVGSGRILIRQKVSQSDLAAMAGIARENFSRILQDWIRQSLVSRPAGYYCLEDKAALEREGECVGAPRVTSRAPIGGDLAVAAQ
jgi:CRP/FNR family transcriptional regulator, cyclic AMP receptor protein